MYKKSLIFTVIVFLALPISYLLIAYLIPPAEGEIRDGFTFWDWVFAGIIIGAFATLAIYIAVNKHREKKERR